MHRFAMLTSLTFLCRDCLRRIRGIRSASRGSHVNIGSFYAFSGLTAVFGLSLKKSSTTGTISNALNAISAFRVAENRRVNNAVAHAISKGTLTRVSL